MKKFLFFLAFCIFLLPLLYAKGAEGEILTFPANSKAGFEWGYAIYLPKDLDTSEKLPILFTMNNSGAVNTVEEMKQRTMDEIENNRIVYEIPDALNVPMLMPFVLRKRGSNLDPHNFNRVAFLSQDPKYQRMDLQVLAMIKDARKQLKKRGIKTHKKILVAGYSAAGAFGESFTFLHPDKVLAATIGGNHYPILPLKEKDGIALLFPTGAYDVKKVTGKDFNKKKWLKVPILDTNGAVDYNDPLPHDDVMLPEERTMTLDLYGYGTTAVERWEAARKILKEIAPNMQTHTYPNLEHRDVREDTITFLKAHKNGGPLKPIKLTDTSDRIPPVPVYVSALYWGQKAPIKTGREYLEDNDLILKTSTRPPFWVKDNYILDVIYKKDVIIKDKEIIGVFNDKERGEFFLQAHFSDEEVKLLKSKKNAHFGVKVKLAPYLIDPRWKVPILIVIPENLTFTVK